MSDLDRLLAAIERGRGGLALVTGEAGSGKTTLTLKLSDRAARQGMSVQWSACSVHAVGRPYWPWSQLIQGHLTGVGPEESAPLMATITPALASLAPGLAAGLDVMHPSWPVDQCALFQTVARFWTAAARADRPVLLRVSAAAST